MIQKFYSKALFLLRNPNEISRIFLESFRFLLLGIFRQISSILPKYFEVGVFGFRIGATYFIIRNAGLFSVVSTTLSDLHGMKSKITRVNSSLGLVLYKNKIFQDIWPILFRTANYSEDVSGLVINDFENKWVSEYTQSELSELAPTLKSTFAPSDIVLQRKNQIEFKYGLDLDKCIAMHFRATDKVTEVSDLELSIFIEKVQALKENYPDFSVLVQTDSSEAFNSIRSQIDSPLIKIVELPQSDTSVGAHYLRKKDRIEDAINYFAVLLILSECRFLVTHTGNGGLWEYIYRNHNDGFVQIFQKSI